MVVTHRWVRLYSELILGMLMGSTNLLTGSLSTEDSHLYQTTLVNQLLLRKPWLFYSSSMHWSNQELPAIYYIFVAVNFIHGVGIEQLLCTRI